MRSRGGRRRSSEILIEASKRAGYEQDSVFNVRLPHTLIPSLTEGEENKGEDRWTDHDAKNKRESEG